MRPGGVRGKNVKLEKEKVAYVAKVSPEGWREHPQPIVVHPGCLLSPTIYNWGRKPKHSTLHVESGAIGKNKKLMVKRVSVLLYIFSA